MAIRERKGLWALGAALLFILGAGAGVLLVKKFYAPSPLLPNLPISQLLAETHLLLDKGQFDEAERNYRAVLDREPGNPEAITHLGNIAAQR